MTIRLLLGTAAIVAVAVFLFGTEPSSGDIASAYLNTFEREAVKAGAKSTERLSGKRLQVESEILLTRAKHEIKVDSVEVPSVRSLPSTTSQFPKPPGESKRERSARQFATRLAWIRSRRRAVRRSG